MTPLLERVRAELRRRAAPPTEMELIVWFLTSSELRQARDALRVAERGEPLDDELLARLERRAKVRRRIGWLPGGPKDRPERLEHRAWWRPKYDWCLNGIGGCDCLRRTLDSSRRLATRRGLEHHARRLHDRHMRETQPSVFDPNYKPEREREPEWNSPRALARVLPFRKRKDSPAPTEPESPALDPALEARAPLETVEQLSRRIGVPLMPIPGEEDR